MEMLLYVPPLELFLKGEAIKAQVRNQDALQLDWAGVNSNGDVSHMVANDLLSDSYGVPDVVWDKQAARLRFDNRFTVETDSFEAGDDICPPNSVIVYTDGSRIKDKDTGVFNVGSGFLVTKTDVKGERTVVGHESHHLQDYNTVFQAEATAMERAARYLFRNTMRNPKQVYILTDSMSLLQSLQKHWADKRTINKLLDTLNDLGAHANVKLRWVKAHANSEFNKRADTLAKLGALPAQAEAQGFGVTPAPDVPGGPVVRRRPFRPRWRPSRSRSYSC